MKRILLSLASMIVLAGCETVKPYQKEFFSHPLMEEQDDSTSLLKNEKLKLDGGGPSGSACPTCG